MTKQSKLVKALQKTISKWEYSSLSLKKFYADTQYLNSEYTRRNLLIAEILDDSINEIKALLTNDKETE